MILTIDAAFQDSNIVSVENALFELNRNGIFDPNFLLEVKKHVTTQEANANVEELLSTQAQTKTVAIQ